MLVVDQRPIQLAGASSRDDVLNRLIQCIGRDGALLLGVGLREDGTIDKDDALALRTIGLWLDENGEAVYGTRGGPWLPDAGASPPARATTCSSSPSSSTTGTSPCRRCRPRCSRHACSRARRWDCARAAAASRSASRAAAATSARLPSSSSTLDREAMTLPVMEVSQPKPLSQGKPVEVSGEWKGREKQLSKTHVNDGDFNTVWAAPENWQRLGTN